MGMCMVSYKELDVLGEGLSDTYDRRFGAKGGMCFDIEGFITDYLKLKIMYESFATEDKSKLGFLSNGKDPLKVYRAGKATDCVFPEGSIVIERFLLGENQAGRRRFTLAHEAAHYVLEQYVPMQTSYYHAEFDVEAEYSTEELSQMFSLNESLADRLGAAFLMSEKRVRRALGQFNASRKIIFYDGLFSQEDKIVMQRMANCLGVNYSSLLIRLKELGMLERRPMAELLNSKFSPGGVV